VWPSVAVGHVKWGRQFCEAHQTYLTTVCAANRVAFHSAEELEMMMQDPHALAKSLLKLKEYFPEEDISQLVIDEIRFVDPLVVAQLPKVIRFR
jgi:hypothetical protein